MLQVFAGHQSEEGVLGDYCDGTDFANHPLFSRDQHALQIILYYDECEMANPLGSSLHKLGKTICHVRWAFNRIPKPTPEIAHLSYTVVYVHVCGMLVTGLKLIPAYQSTHLR
jgi:hypothetical protein